MGKGSAMAGRLFGALQHLPMNAPAATTPYFCQNHNAWQAMRKSPGVLAMLGRYERRAIARGDRAVLLSAGNNLPAPDGRMLGRGHEAADLIEPARVYDSPSSRRGLIENSRV